MARTGRYEEEALHKAGVGAIFHISCFKAAELFSPLISRPNMRYDSIRYTSAEQAAA
jgi:hypothetical protein